MKVLWITNSLFPEAKEKLTGEHEQIKGSGGWLSASAEALVVYSNIQLAIVAISKLVKQLTHVKGERIEYYIIPEGNGNISLNKEYIPFWRDINRQFKPDVIHLHGTELSHGWSLLEALPDSNIVITIQGVMSQICRFYTSGMSRKDVLCSITLRDIVHDIIRRKEMSGSLIRKQKNFFIKGANECLILQKAKAVIGRTMWDRANITAINPNVKYFVCNETLRNEFYTGKWEYEKCCHHTIFLSQASYPYKGLHMLIKALPIILKDFPDTKVVIAGGDILGGNSIKEKLLKSGYSKYLDGLIKKMAIKREIINFTGPLDAEGMKRQYLKCNVFVSPSSIENSPNSVCEAQMLGVPIVASYVGGTADMIPDSLCGKMYRFEDVEMLAYWVKYFFQNSINFDGTHEMLIAHNRHCIKANLEQLIGIYNSMGMAF